MIDIETFGRGMHSAITAIGYAVFTAEKVLYQGTIVPSMPEQLKAGLTMDFESVCFWLSQPKETQEALLNQFKYATPFKSALNQLADKIFQIDGGLIWICGNRDIIWMESAYTACGMDVPWRYNQMRDFRTIRELSGIPAPERTGLHDAKADALYQAEYLIQICKEKGWEIK